MTIYTLGSLTPVTILMCSKFDLKIVINLVVRCHNQHRSSHDFGHMDYPSKTAALDIYWPLEAGDVI